MIDPGLRALFDDLDASVQGARAALEASDMQAWAEHAGRGAEIHEALAHRFGWREQTGDGNG